MDQHEQQAQTMQSNEPSGELKHNIRTLASLVRQSYDIFNTFGKQPESLENILKGFSMVLAKYDDDVITNAFKVWMNENSNMPTPADIRKICQTRVFVCSGKNIPLPAKQEEVREIEPEYVRDVEEVRKLVEECKKNLSMPRGTQKQK